MHVKITIIIKSHDTDYSATTAPRFYPLSIKGFFPPIMFWSKLGYLLLLRILLL